MYFFYQKINEFDKQIKYKKKSLYISYAILLANLPPKIFEFWGLSFWYLLYLFYSKCWNL